MEKNQNDNRNQNSDSMSKQSTTQDDKKRETNPNNPTATKNQLNGNEQHKGTTTGKRPTDSIDSENDVDTKNKSKKNNAQEEKKVNH